MREVNSLFDLCERIGIDQVDAELAVWIEQGHFDNEVKERAKELGWIAPDTPYSELDRPIW